MIIQPAVPATSPAGLTNFVTNPTSNTAFVSVGANGATMANYWVNAVSVATSAASFMMSVPPGGTCALQYTVATPVWYWSPYTIALPASTVAAVNNTGRDINVMFVGSGSVTAVTINGLTTNIVQAPTMYTGGTPLPPGASIAVTYSGSVAWAWTDPISAQVLSHSDGTVYAQMNTIAPTGAGGFNEYTELPYAQHAALAQTGLATGVAN
jgi:hypothetical protein